MEQTKPEKTANYFSVSTERKRSIVSKGKIKCQWCQRYIKVKSTKLGPNSWLISLPEGCQRYYMRVRNDRINISSNRFFFSCKDCETIKDIIE